MAAAAYADRQGVIGFSVDHLVPEGVLVFARHRDIAQLHRIVSPKARHAKGSETLLVPGVPEANTESEARAAFDMWRDWSFSQYRMVNGAALITDDAEPLDDEASAIVEGRRAAR
jgi:hypothetical protein